MAAQGYARQYCQKWSKTRNFILFPIMVFFFISSISCSLNNTNESIRKQIEAIQGQKITFMLDSMSCFYGMEEVSAPKEMLDAYKFVLFTDNDECSSCALTSLYEWEPLIERESKKHKSKIDFVFIFSPKVSEISNLKKKILHANIRHHIFIDSKGLFMKYNDIPNNHLFHAFLVDSCNRIVVIGNPLRSEKVRDLMDKVIEGSIKDNFSTNFFEQ